MTPHLEQSPPAVRRVLVFPAGTEIGLEILASLKDCKEVELFGAGEAACNHAQFSYPSYHVVPNIREANWLDALKRLCVELRIDYIFPAYDDVIVALSAARDQIPAQIICPPDWVCDVTRSKAQTYALLKDVVRVPALYASEAEVVSYPVLVKPDRGQGSFGISKATTPDELRKALASLPDPLICEFLPGREYTVDCFSDRERGLLFHGVRSRRRVRNGISVNTVTEQLPQAAQWAEAIGSAFQMQGAWFFQVKCAQDGELALLEVAPRIAGAMATHRVMGVNFALLSIFEAERKPLCLLTNPGRVEMDRALQNRYRHQIDFDHLYLDLDDTLILRGQVNTDLVALVFQCLNRGCKVSLITRHAGDLTQTLARHRLQGLFDEVIHLTVAERKSDHVQGAKAIFVDDSFCERLDVSKRCGIPTFDASMTEMLLKGQHDTTDRRV